MSNKKLLIVGLIIANLCFVYIMYVVFNSSNKINEQLSNISDDYIYVSNYLGYTLDDIEYIENIEGIESVEFVNYYDYESIDFINNFETKPLNIYSNYYGGQIFEGNDMQDSFTFLAGEQAKEENDIIISQMMADEIIASEKIENIKEYDDFIGKKLEYNEEIPISLSNEGEKKIVGVYEDTKYVREGSNGNLSENDAGQNDYQQNINYNKWYRFGYYYVPSNNQEEIEDVINSQLNYYLSWNYENGYNYKNNLIVHNNENGDIDYDASIEKGAKGLIDPKTTDYGDYFYNEAIIKVEDEADKDEIITTIDGVKENQLFISGDYKLSDYRNLPLYISLAILIMIILNLIMFIPFYKRK